MAEAKTDPTQIDDAASKVGSSKWVLIVENIFPQWRDRVGSKDAKDEVEALLCDPETRSAIRKVDASGKEIPGTSRHVDHPEFWQDRLSLVPDADGGPDHLAVDYPDSIYLPDGHWEGFVRRLDVERHERLYFPMTTTPPPAPSKEPTPSKELSNKPRQKPGPKPDSEYWEKMEAKCHELMDQHGNFDASDPEWNHQARLEKALLDFSQNTLGRELGESTLRAKLPGWLSKWHKRKTGAA